MHWLKITSVLWAFVAISVSWQVKPHHSLRLRSLRDNPFTESVEPLFPLLVERSPDGHNSNQAVEPLFPLLGESRDVGHANTLIPSKSVLASRIYRILKKQLQHIPSQSNLHSAHHAHAHPQSLHHSNPLFSRHGNRNPTPDDSSSDNLLDSIDRILKKNNADLIVLPEDVDRICNTFLKTNELSYAPLTLVRKVGDSMSKQATDLILPPEKVERLCNNYLSVNSDRDDSDENNNNDDLRKFSYVKGDEDIGVIPDKYWKKGYYGDEAKESVPSLRSVDYFPEPYYDSDESEHCPLCQQLAQVIRDHSVDVEQALQLLREE